MLTPLRFWRRLRAVLRFRALDRETDDELRHHLEMEAADGVKAGLEPVEAARRARLALGDPLVLRERGREARGVAGVLDLAADLRYAVRVLRRAPVFTAVASLTLALGIGANTAIFSVVHAVLLRPLPFADPASLVSVWDGGHSRAEFRAIRERTRTLSGVAAYRPGYGVSLGGEGEPQQVVSALVSAEFFEVLGVRPALGRFFRAGDDQPGREPVVVLSHGLWRERFGADPGVIGRAVIVEGLARRVLGVAPEGVRFPDAATRLWFPLTLNADQPGPFWGAFGFQVIGRLRPGLRRERVREEMRRLAAELRLENPVWRPGAEYTDGIEVSDLRRRLVGDSRRLLLVLVGAASLVLLIACANVANLFIVRGAARERELALRAVLGAGQGRLVRQLLAEGLVLAAAGAALGLLVAFGGTRLLVGILPASIPRLGEVSVDAGALAFTAGLALVVGLVFGMAPALRVVHDRLGETAVGGRVGVGVRHRRLARALVTAQIGLGVVLAIGAGLLGRSVAELLVVDPGFRADHAVTLQVTPPKLQYAAPERQRALAAALTERLAGAPGLSAAGISTQVPFDGTNPLMATWVDGWTTDRDKLDLFEIRRVSPGFFAAMGIALRQGRGFDARDVAGGAPTAIVSETAVRRFWSGRPVLGGQVRFPWPGWMTVVGVVADVRNNDLRSEALPTLYVPYDQQPEPGFGVVARTTGRPDAALAQLRDAVRAVAPDVPVAEARTLDDLLDRSVSAPRSAGILLTAFGGLALVLGVVGTYGLVAYGVERRSREIALRLAVGAGRGDVLGLVMREGIRLAGGGAALGLLAAFGLTRVLDSLLYAVSATDPVAFTAAPLLLVGAALAACLVPAWRASRLDPAATLRND